MSSLENILSASNGARPRAGIIQRCLEKYFRDPPPPLLPRISRLHPYYSSRLFFRQIFPFTIFPSHFSRCHATLNLDDNSQTCFPLLGRSGVCDDSFCNIGGGVLSTGSTSVDPVA